MVSDPSPAGGRGEVGAALTAAAASLSGSDTPRLDADLLMAHAFGIGREELLLSHLDDAAVPPAFASLLARRARGEPVAYITGRRAFWTIEIEVGPGVLIPRPDSETLIEAAVAHFGRAGPGAILDLGSGPGTLLLATLDQWPRARGLGIDRSEAALAIARRNAARLGLGDRAHFQAGDWGEGLGRRFALILCNPPYIEEGAVLPRDVADWEPREALFAGADGLDAYRRLAPQIPRLLDRDGIACVEIGPDQADAAAALFAARGLGAAPRRDLAGRVRCLVLSR